MAIQSNFQKFGVTFEDAYTKVKSLEYVNTFDVTYQPTEDPAVAAVPVMVKKLKVSFIAITTAEGTQDQLEMSKYEFVSETAGDLIGECYSYLKDLEAFADAVDA